MKITIINGPNLNLLGAREPEKYGSVSFESYLDTIRVNYPNITISYFQSNIEGELIDFLQACEKEGVSGIIINAAAYTHTSIAIGDALAAIKIPSIEVHITNIMAREDFRKHSYLSSQCVGSISGLGLFGYELALKYFLNKNGY